MVSKLSLPNNRISRRKALKIGGAAAATGLLYTPAIHAASSNKVVVGTWGGTYGADQKETLFDPFTEATGIEVEIINGSAMNSAAAKRFVETGTYEWDAAGFGQIEFTVAHSNGLLEPIDYSVVSSDDKTPDTQFHDFGVSISTTSETICYRTDVFGDDGPRTWADYWDVEKYPGPRGMWKNAYTFVVFCLLADGVPYEEVYPLDLERAFAKADEIKDDVTVWWTSGSQSQDVIRSKNVVMTELWSGRAAALKKEGVPIEISYDSGVLSKGWWVIPKGAPNRENAMKLFDFIAGPKPGADFATRQLYGPTNLKSIDLIEPDLRPLMNTSPENFDKQLQYEGGDYWVENLAKVNERFLTWLVT